MKNFGGCPPTTAKKRRPPKLACVREDENIWRAPADDRQFSNLEDRGGPPKTSK
ncbi:MAG: hypothetical protein GY820_33290, partial [Gammaproteobacteria bacterium]|nr:hypothetical protein [Gammaproteobacteria bacterium]